jgi:hypothetical protein
MVGFAQTYQQLCAKLNDSEIFVIAFGRHRATRARGFFDPLQTPVVQFTRGFQE